MPKIHKVNGKYIKFDEAGSYFGDTIDSYGTRLGNHVGNTFRKPGEHVENVFDEISEFHDEGGFNAFVAKCGTPLILCALVGMAVTEFTLRLASLPFAAPYEGIKEASYHHEAKKNMPRRENASVKHHCCLFGKKSRKAADAEPAVAPSSSLTV